ncbi:MAG: class I SAM-dependent methyltransferase [Verrucomicrobiae bacterium]|nr:class I SAM-dependent methyltransferase [Verrucomicrobiae bacterium]
MMLNHFRRWRVQRSWERKWRTPNYRPDWLADTPRPFVLTGFDAGWLVPGQTVLEIGCGLGTTAAWLAQHGLEVLAVDISSHVIEQAQKNFPNQPGLEFRCADVCAPVTCPTVFDVIIDTGCLQHIPPGLRDCYRKNLLAWSRTGSRFVLTMHQRDRTAAERLAEVQSLFSAGFELVHTQEMPPPNAEKFNHLNSIFHFVRR